MSEYSNNFSLIVNIKFARDVVLKSYSPFPLLPLILKFSEIFPFQLHMSYLDKYTNNWK